VQQTDSHPAAAMAAQAAALSSCAQLKQF